MSSRFTEFYKKKRGKRSRKSYENKLSNLTSSEHASTSSTVKIKKNIAHCVKTSNIKKSDTSLTSQSSSIPASEKSKKSLLKKRKASKSQNLNAPPYSQEFELQNESTGSKSRKRLLKKIKKNTKLQSTGTDQNSLENNQVKIQEAKECSRKQKRKQRKSKMESPSAKVLKKDNFNQITENHSFHSQNSNHKHQNNHRKCSTKCRDDLMRGDSESKTGPPELPGFYYDKEKKKYFKILPNNSCIGNAVTTASIKIKEKEEVRKSDLINVQNYGIESRRRPQRQYLSTNCLPCLTNRFQHGDFSPRELNYTLNTIRIRNINKAPQTKIRIYADSRRDWLERLEHASQLEMMENKHIVGLFTIKESMIQRILWLKLSNKPSTSQKDRLSLSIDPSPSCRYYQSAVKIASMCLIDKDSVLYTGMVYTGTPESLVFIKGLAEGSSRYEVYSLGQKATWACAWNKHANQFSVGSEKCGMLLDVQTRRLWQINSNNSDVLCQVFSKQNGHCLYSGTRKNDIFTHDLRSISTYSVSHLTQSSSVCGLDLLQNDIHLLASDVKGKVNMWDLRTRKVVTEYHGMKNEYLRIPIHVDQSEEIVYGVDQDGYTRLWCLKTGDLLKTIPPPTSTSYDFFPSVLYSKTWNDRPGNAGLLMGLGDKVYIYSDYQDEL